MEEPANRMWNKASTKKLQKYNKGQNTKVIKNPELTGLKWSGTALADIKRLLSEENGTWSQVGYLHMLQQIEPISLHAEKCHFLVKRVLSAEITQKAYSTALEYFIVHGSTGVFALFNIYVYLKWSNRRKSKPVLMFY